MRKFILVTLMSLMLVSCGAFTAASTAAQSAQQSREAASVAVSSEYAKTINKLELIEANFQAYRRVVFYNVRQDVTVCVCEGYIHVNIDNDGDVELVARQPDGTYLRHYLGKQPDCTYFSIQLEGSEIPNNTTYQVYFNPKLWIPDFKKVN